MGLRIILDIFSGLPNPAVELEGEEARRLLDRLKPTGCPSESSVPPKTYPILGYRGLIFQQKGRIARRFPKEFFVKDGLVYGQDLFARIANASTEDDLLGAEGPFAKGEKNSRLWATKMSQFRSEPEPASQPTSAAGEGTAVVTPTKRSPKANKARAASERTDPCRCAPLYEPTWWNDGGQIQINNNCYNYATNYRSDTFAQPGRAAGGTSPLLRPALDRKLAIGAGRLRSAGRIFASLTCASLQAATLDDDLILTPKQANECPDQGHLVALVVAPGFDFHWYRKDRGGSWSHKPGGTQVTDVDNSGSPISDPRRANRGPYTQFCCFMEVHHGHIKII